MYRYKLILQRYLGIKWLTRELERAKIVWNSDNKQKGLDNGKEDDN